MTQDLIKNGKAGKSSTSWRPAIVPVLALTAVCVLPPMLKGLYKRYTSQLMVAHVSFGLLFIALVLGGLSLMVIRDLDDGTEPVRPKTASHRINTERKKGRGAMDCGIAGACDYPGKSFSGVSRGSRAGDCKISRRRPVRANII